MPLTRDPDSITCRDERIGIGFTMLNGAAKVVVWIDKGALRVLSDGYPVATEMAAFEQSRETVEAAAAANYDAGIIEPDGSTIIRRDDVERLG